MHPVHVLKDREDNARNIQIVNTPVAGTEKCTRRTSDGPNQTDGGIALEPGVHVLRQQFRILLQHLVIVGRRNFQVGTDLPVGDGIDLQRLQRRDTGLVIGIEIQLRAIRLQTEVAGVQRIVGF